MALDRESKIAIAASIFWMALATFVILGTHGQSMAKADTVEPTLEPTTEWQAHPAHFSNDVVSLADPSRC